jgi:hypothetical protein
MVSNRKIVTTGSKRVEPVDYQDVYRTAWAQDAKAAQDRIERAAAKNSYGTRNADVNETLALKNASIGILRRAKQQCSSCGKLRLPDDLISPVQRGAYGSRVCGDNPTCLEKAKRWARTPGL